MLSGLPADAGPQDVGNVRALISRLNTVLTADDVNAEKEREIKKRIADVQLQLEPFEEVRLKLKEKNKQFKNKTLEETSAVPEGLHTDTTINLAGFGRHGAAIWPIGTVNLVGVLLGYHGTGHLLRRLRHHHGHVRLLCGHSTGTQIPSKNAYKIACFGRIVAKYQEKYVFLYCFVLKFLLSHSASPFNPFIYSW